MSSSTIPKRIVSPVPRDRYRLTAYLSSALRQLKKINYANRKACRDCPSASVCTDNQFRTVSRLENEAVLDRMQDRLAKSGPRFSISDVRRWNIRLARSSNG